MRYFLIFIILTSALVSNSQDSVNLKLMFMGDIMQHGHQLRAATKPDGTYDYSPNYKYVKPIIESADIAIGNLELTLSGSNYSGYPSFSAPDELAVAVKDAGIDFLVTANNHSLDRRKKGLERTLLVLDSLDIPHTGTFMDSLHRAQTYPAIIESKGIRLAILNYTYGTNGIPVTAPNIVNLLDRGQMAEDLEKAKSMNSDFIIVFTHWGLEYQRLPNKEQVSLTEFLFNNGANLVIGSHPHVLQPVEWKNPQQLVAYSLGNFVSNQRKRYTNGGMILEIDLMKTDNVEIKDASYHLTYVHTTPDPGKQFHILPVSLFLNDDDIPGLEGAESSMLEFMSDSRNLFADNNLNVDEIKNFPSLNYQESIIGFGGEWVSIPREYTQPVLVKKEKKVIEKPIVAPKQTERPWRVQIMATSQKAVVEIPWDNLIIIEDQKAGLYKYQVGPWATREEAEDNLAKIRSVEGWEDAFIVHQPKKGR